MRDRERLLWIGNRSVTDCSFQLFRVEVDDSPPALPPDDCTEFSHG
jgi:hypothetical protein